MKTTRYQWRYLEVLAAGGSVLSYGLPATKHSGWWLVIEGVPIRRIADISVRMLLTRGWIVATRKPGGKEYTGRAVITRLGR